MLQKCDIVSESFERIFSDLLCCSRFACQLLYNHVSRASIIHHFIFVSTFIFPITLPAVGISLLQL